MKINYNPSIISQYKLNSPLVYLFIHSLIWYIIYIRLLWYQFVTMEIKSSQLTCMNDNASIAWWLTIYLFGCVCCPCLHQVPFPASLPTPNQKLHYTTGLKETFFRIDFLKIQSLIMQKSQAATWNVSVTAGNCGIIYHIVLLQTFIYLSIFSWKTGE